VRSLAWVVVGAWDEGRIDVGTGQRIVVCPVRTGCLHSMGRIVVQLVTSSHHEYVLQVKRRVLSLCDQTALDAVASM
jgi:hypothetical protein